MRELSSLVMNITEGKRAAHAFIIEGPSGPERDSFMISLAQGLECTCPDQTMRPCGTCSSCRQIAAGTALDIVRMSKSKGSGRTARETYKTEDAAAFIERLGMGAYGRFLIGVIEDADSMSEVVQNKLLKTLEEPAPDTLIFLEASNRDNLLSTVRSRCSIIRMSDYTDSDSEGSDPQTKVLAELTGTFTDPRSRYHEFRTAVDKHVKSREEALLLLDMLEDEMRGRMMSSLAGDMAGLQNAACVIELTAEARMDIRREMTYAKTLKRLFLEIRTGDR